MHEIAFCDRKFVQNNLVKGAASQNGRAWLLLISLTADSTTVLLGANIRKKCAMCQNVSASHFCHCLCALRILVYSGDLQRETEVKAPLLLQGGAGRAADVRATKCPSASTLPPFRHRPIAPAAPPHPPHGPRRHRQTGAGPRTANAPASAHNSQYYQCQKYL